MPYWNVVNIDLLTSTVPSDRNLESCGSESFDHKEKLLHYFLGNHDADVSVNFL